ncbi:MAG: hypothetical protein JKY37_24495, partial [Nannocystaceae bacterium]|nr:hypothetical protein [Nannocystaceae bacterium]
MGATSNETAGQRPEASAGRLSPGRLGQALRRLGGGLAFFAMLGAATTLHEDVAVQREQWPPQLDVLYVPPPGNLRPMSLGYREALADLVWIRALVFTGEHIGKTDIDFVERYVEGINGLAPRFYRPYTWGAITAIYGGQGKITRPMVERASRIYERGLVQFPESHELLYSYGMLLTTQVGSTPGYTEQEREAFAADGVERIRRAAAFGADPLVRRYAATLITEYASDALAIQFLESQLAGAQEEAHRRLLRRKLSRLAGADRVHAIEAVREEFFE